jgi:NAD(P)-dependent dehydrogenase (short-subunit alcohol dehydrogenase family)
MSKATTHRPRDGRVALVTAAARGIGQAIAVGLAERGASVVLGDIDDRSETTELIAGTGGSAVAARLDISDPSAIDTVRGRIADELGRVDILVNNAAIFEAATWEDLDFDLWRRIMGVNLNGPMLMCKAFLPLMQGRGWGRAAYRRRRRVSWREDRRDTRRSDPPAHFAVGSAAEYRIARSAERVLLRRRRVPGPSVWVPAGPC